MSEITDALRSMAVTLNDVAIDLDNAPEAAEMRDLFKALKSIDDYYKNEFCKELDETYEETPGTTYKNGISLEFEIEASWWHEVSLILRKYI